MRATAVLLLALCGQLLLPAVEPHRASVAAAIPQPPTSHLLRLLDFGDPIPFAQMLTLHLQSIDRQPGASIPLGELDYERVEGWLQGLLDLDPASAYPLLLATHVYAQAPDPVRQRRMLQFAYRAFSADPDGRWRWLAHACLVARHRLHDVPLALHYASALAASSSAGIPPWALQLEALLREELGEREAARVLLGALLADGRVTDPQEVNFLVAELDRLDGSDQSSSSLTKKQ